MNHIRSSEMPTSSELPIYSPAVLPTYSEVMNERSNYSIIEMTSFASPPNSNANGNFMTTSIQCLTNF